MKPTAITLFSGCGGSHLGLEMAGFETRLGCEWSKNAAKCFEVNFPNTPLFFGDICNLSGNLALQVSNLKQGELDLCQISAPCQGFSMMGKKQASDKRNSLYAEGLRIVEFMQPKVVVIENVKGLVCSRMAHIYLEMIDSLRELGYQAKGEVLDAAYYGVNQSRERVIIVGVRNDLNLQPTFPTPQSLPLSYKEAIADLEIPDHEPFAKISELKKERWKYLDAENPYLIPRKNKWFTSTHIKFNWNDIPTTILTVASSLPYHPDVCRQLHVAEAAALSGFPKDFKFIGTRTDQVRLIGNCVPPPLMSAIASHIKENILNKH
jgi:DNA (cytosine-5)-methyltransferase 1